MFEREIKFIYDFNLNKINKLGPYFTYEHLTTVGLHPAILNYISAELDYIIFEDRQKLVKNSIFDYSGEKISHYFTLITEEVKRSKRLSFEYVSKLILHASSFTINFLVRPNWTLLKFIFDEGDHKTSNEIKQILNYVYYYNYLRKIIISYINSKKILSINFNEFEELLSKVDKLGKETYLQSIISTALKSMSEFYNIGEVQKNKISLLAIDTFLEEKQLPDHRERIRVIYGEDLNQKFPISDIKKVLSYVMLEKQEELPLFNTNLDDDIIEEPFTPLPIEIKELEKKDEIDINPKNDQEMENEEPESIKDVDYGIDDQKGDDEISISTPIQKYRIKVNEDNEIEPVDKNGSVVRTDFNSIENITTSEEEIVEEQSVENDNSLIEEENSFDEINEEVNDEEENSVIDEIVDEEKFEKEKDEEVTKIDDTLENKEEIPKNDIVNEQNNEDEEIHFSNFAFDVEEKKLNDSVPEAEPDLNEAAIAPEPMDIMHDDDEKETMLKSILKFHDDDKSVQHQMEEEIIFNEKVDVNKEEEVEENSKIDLSELLEHKDMTRIIEVIFDYDIEEFAATLEEISVCKNIDDAFKVLNTTFKNHSINHNSKEAESFKSIISKYFN